MFQSGTLRAPAGPQTNFASEQLIDQLAKEANMDPLSFRRQNMRTDGDFFRWTAVLEAAVAASGYKAHVAASNLGKGNVVEGWGMAIGTHGASRAATVAHIQVDKSSGKITILHLTAGQDSGLAISPELIENQMSGNLQQGASKILHEELQFSKNRVTSHGLGQLSDAALQGAPEGDDGRRRPERTRTRRARASRRRFRSVLLSRTRSTTQPACASTRRR